MTDELILIVQYNKTGHQVSSVVTNRNCVQCVNFQKQGMIIFFLGDYNIQIVAITEIEPSL
jgi:hypothetical protein